MGGLDSHGLSNPFLFDRMAVGWRDAPGKHAPGFPQDGKWTVRWENLNASLMRTI